jgi:protein TonB
VKKVALHLFLALVALFASGLLYLAVPLVNVLFLEKPPRKNQNLEEVIQQAVEVTLPPKQEKPKEIKTMSRKPVPNFKPMPSMAFSKPFQMDLSLASGGDGVAAGGDGTGDGSGGIGGKGLGSEVYEPGQVDVQAKVLKEVNPEFPARARKDGVSGYVKLYLVVDVRGNAIDVQVLAVDPKGYGFEMEAVKAMRQFRFAPARLQDVPVAQKFTKEFIFDLGY